MYEIEYIEEVKKEIQMNKKVALAIITDSKGSTPRENGAMMVIKEDESIVGTIGGGKIEYDVLKRAKECLETGESKKYNYELTEKGELGMTCGGQAEIFIKVFNKKNILLIVGGGHIAQRLYKLGEFLDFKTVVFETRKEIIESDIFPGSVELKTGDIIEELNNYPISDNSYIVLVSKGHKDDLKALREVYDSEAKYIGMIGSIRKCKNMIDTLVKEGIEREKLKKVFAPIGLDLGGETPEEIAFSIMSQILAVKNESTAKSMKYNFFK
ncbi:XdhC family protein [Senegalia massiliensis]|uniref:XdhC family protein n=1 Tax=Senegalia massiliensis TaxID=1720316 RepID=UPI0010317D0F|nr:XdhC/CoxI family protein [Senegalia massiliensis]